MDAIEVLIKYNIIKSRESVGKAFAINLTRDGNIKTLDDIIKAMEEYADYKSDVCPDCGSTKPCDC